MKYGLDMTIADVQSDPDALSVFSRILPGLLDKVGQNPQTANLSIRKLAEYTRGMISEQALSALQQGLEAVGEKNGGLSCAERKRIEQYRDLAKQVSLKAAEKRLRPEHFDRTCFTPGQPWLDTQGERIQAHGGALRCEDGVFYWYGENKEFTDGKSRIWHWGVRAYSSKDLYNWTDLGLIIPPNTEDPASNLFPESRMTRPHIVRSAATGKYVCWMVVAGNDACFSVLEADHLTGPYTLIREHYRPFGHAYSDFDLAVDEDGSGWMIVDVDHSSLYTFRLSPDLLSVAEQVSISYEGLHPPFCREAASVFTCGGMRYLLTSGMTGYLPNRSDAAISPDWTSPFRSIGDPYPDDITCSSFNSQFTQIFPLPGKEGLFIALSDRWNADFLMDAHRSDVAGRVIAAHYDPAHYPVTQEERAEYQTFPSLHETDTSKADYVWLPVSFDGSRIRIKWLDNWKWETLYAPESDSVHGINKIHLENNKEEAR